MPSNGVELAVLTTESSPSADSPALGYAGPAAGELDVIPGGASCTARCFSDGQGEDRVDVEPDVRVRKIARRVIREPRDDSTFMPSTRRPESSYRLRAVPGFG